MGKDVPRPHIGAVPPARPRFSQRRPLAAKGAPRFVVGACRPCHTRRVRRLPESLDALREREFRLLWLGRSLSSVGDALVPVAAAFAVLEIGTATDLGIVLGASMGGRLVFTLVGGVWADRLPRRLIMITSDAIRAAVQAVLALAFFTDSIEVWHLAVGSTIFGISGAFFGPASTGLIPQIVSAGRLQEANALLGLSRNAIELFGPAVAGVLVATAGYAVVYVVDAASFVASLSCLALMRPLGAVHTRAQSFLTDVREGVREVLARPWMRATLTADLFANFAIAPYFVLGPLVVREHLGGPADWGLMMATGAAGGIVGGALVLRWKPKRLLVAAYCVLIAIPLALLSLVPPLPLPLLMLGAALFTFSIVVGNTFWSTAEQQHIPNEVLGRVDSVSWMVSIAIMPLAYVVAGPLADAIGVRNTLLVAAAIGLSSSAGALLSRSVRDLRRLEGEPTSSPGLGLAAESEPPGPVTTAQVP
jgi:MFS family permease